MTTTTNRIPTPSANGVHAKSTGAHAKPHPQGRPREVRTRPKRRAKTATHGADPSGSTCPSRPWAMFGVATTGVLSAGLNGYANAQHATIPWAGWLLGIAVPVLVLTLAKVAGEKWQHGEKAQLRVALFAAGSGAALLLLSVWHCATSIALLTGSPALLALPMAVAIDMGLVACEVALVTGTSASR